MFMDQSKYQPQSTACSRFYSDELTEMDNQFSQFNQYDLETAEVFRHVCPVCDKTFRASSLLDIHMRVHVGAKPFVCPVCSHRATQKGNLKLHMKKHHGQDLPSHIDLVPDSGIWGSFSNNENIGEAELNFYLNTKKKTALAHSSLLNEDVVEIIKKCQNNIGQSTMGRITESLTDFLDIAKQRIQYDNNSSKQGPLKEEVTHENINSNNNGMKSLTVKSEKGSPSLTAIAPYDAVRLSIKKNLQEQPSNASQKQYCFCKICGWKTTSSGYLNVHMRKHKAESHICTICGRAFKETWYLKNHMRSHVNDMVHEREQRSAQHGRVLENTFGRGSETHFQEIDENSVHEKTNKEATNSMCSKCGLIFPNQSLPAHIDNCGRPDSRIEVCKVCECANDKAAFMSNLGLAIQKHSKNDNKGSANVKQFNSLIGNYLINLPEKNPNNVSLPSSASPLYSLKEEIKNSIAQNGIEATKKSFHELIKNPSFKVLLSSEHLLSIAELFNAEEDQVKNRHLLLSKTNSVKGKTSQYSQIKPYENPAIQSLAFIGKSLTTAEPLRIGTTTNTDNPVTDQHAQGYQCNYCSKRFKYRSVLGIHMRSHTGERPYKCVYCGYAGTQHNCLKLHVQRHHPEVFLSQNETVPGKEKNIEVKADIEQEHMLLSQAAKFSPARCPICDRVSPSPGYLKIHMRSHKTTLDHVCHICGRGFKEYWYLSTHLRTHESEINMPATAAVEEPTPTMRNQSFSKHTDATHRNSVLTKQKSVPLTKQDVSNTGGHGYLRWTSSWCPLNAHEDERTDPSANTNLEITKPEPVKQYVSKRKAFQPSRHFADPYSSQGSTRSRKSKPRKLSNGLYLAPVDEASSSSLLEDMIHKEASNPESLSSAKKSPGTDQPLDLSTTVTTPDSVPWDSNREEEPLNLAVK